MTNAAAPCVGCSSARESNLVQLGISLDKADYIVALAGNPNTGKSTVFNALTGLRQHTGNWPGKTVTRAEGSFANAGQRAMLIDLPGTYSLHAGSTDEEVARDFILFGQPDVTVVVVDATRLERNLNLLLQILEITDRVVVALNLMDEAQRHGIHIDVERLSKSLGVPVVPMVARRSRGITELKAAIDDVWAGRIRPEPYRVDRLPAEVEVAVSTLIPHIESTFPSLPNARWVALRLLNADERVEAAVHSGEIAELAGLEHGLPIGSAAGGDSVMAAPAVEELLKEVSQARWGLSPDFQDGITEHIFADAAKIVRGAVRRTPKVSRFDIDVALDRVLTSRTFGFPLMLLILTAVFWVTISGANVPSAMLATMFLDIIHPFLKGVAATAGIPWWLDGFLLDGVYLGTAWVVSVMLPPMAIFFPIFTLLEDFGYLPRVAFNLDKMFHRVGAHGKQALTMCMGFGCNAAGVVATRIIDSPRERLVAIITNNFSLCNGRWPTQILIASIFIGALAPPRIASLTAAGAVVLVALIGIGAMLFASWLLTRTVLRGEATSFSLELPPYRPPRILQTLYTSLIDRTLIVLWRAIIFAAPAGAVIWLSANIHIGDASIAEHMVNGLNPIGLLLGLNGVIIFAYIVAIPANEIVIPTVLMLSVLMAGATGVGEGVGVMFELDSTVAVSDLLRGSGWTLLTGVNMMLFGLLHNPCSTTIYTIYKETRSIKWTTISTLMPVVMGVIVCFLVAQVWWLAGGTP